MPKLTKRRSTPRRRRPAEHFLWDEEVPGFGLRVLPSGRKSYVVQYRAGRRPRRISLGPEHRPDLRASPHARHHHRRRGAQRRGPRRAARCRATVAKVKELAERFDREHISIRLKPSTAKEYRRNLKRFILPALGRLR